MLSSASSSSQRYSLRTSKRRRSSHHRGRTARARRRKAWSEFSRWEGEDSDDDSDLLHFCRTRGLTRASTAPAQRTSLSSTKEAKDAGNKKASSSLIVSKDLVEEEKSKYISLLCSSLKNKLKFLHESEYRSAEPFDANDSDKEDSEMLNNVAKKPDVILPLKTSKNLSSDTGQPSSNAETSCESSSSSSNSTTKNTSSLLPKIYLKNEIQPEQHCASPDSGLPSTKTVNTTGTSADNSQTAPSKRPVKEWTAEVEANVMRLYESGEPGAGFSVLDSKPLPLKLAQVKDQVEAKLSSADHTPSYVLALANLFRRRMQIRKEFSQVSGEMTNTTLTGSAASLRCYNNSFPLHNTKTTHHKQQGSGDNHPSVSLRYHHVTNDDGIAAFQSNPALATAHPKLQSTAYCSISSPLLYDLPKQDRTSFGLVEEDDDMLLQPEKVSNSVFEQSLVKETPFEESFTSTDGINSSLPRPNEKEPSPKLNNLDELLTVFPKPPQFKFEGFQASSDKPREICFPSTNRLFSSFRGNRGGLLKQENKKNSEPKDILVLSIATSLRKNLRNNKLSREKQNVSHLQKQARSMTTLPKPRQSTSAVPIFPRCYHPPGLSPQHQMSSYSFVDSSHKDPNEKPQLRFFENRKSIDDDLDITLVPVSKVRWSGSLGTLYKKPQLSTEPTEQKSKEAASDVSVRKLTRICDAHISLGAESNRSGPNDSITTSSVEKQSAIAR